MRIDSNAHGSPFSESSPKMLPQQCTQHEDTRGHATHALHAGLGTWVEPPVRCPPCGSALWLDEDTGRNFWPQPSLRHPAHCPASASGTWLPGMLLMQTASVVG